VRRADPGGDRATAFDRAARLLARRGHFRAELERKLGEKGHEPGEIREALDRMVRLGYLDDALLARREAERLRADRGLGRAALGVELRRKGAPEATVDELLEEIPPEDELERARAVAARWQRHHRPDAAALGRHLDRKGYAAGLIRRVLDELVTEARVADGPPDETLES